MSLLSYGEYFMNQDESIFTKNEVWNDYIGVMSYDEFKFQCNL